LPANAPRLADPVGPPEARPETERVGLGLGLAAAVWPVWSLATRASSVASTAWAAATPCCRLAVSRTARVCPARTRLPTATGSCATVPATGKLTVPSFTGVTVPWLSRDCTTEPRLTLANR
jgi:hypothetical protein